MAPSSLWLLVEGKVLLLEPQTSDLLTGEERASTLFLTSPTEALRCDPAPVTRRVLDLFVGRRLFGSFSGGLHHVDSSGIDRVYHVHSKLAGHGSVAGQRLLEDFLRVGQCHHLPTAV